MQLNARSDSAVPSSVVASGTVNEPVQDVQRAAENRTGLSATQLGLNLASDAFTEDELIEQIVSPQKSSRPPLVKMKITEIKKNVLNQFFDSWPEVRESINQKGRDLKRKKKEKERSEQKRDRMESSAD